MSLVHLFLTSKTKISKLVDTVLDKHILWFNVTMCHSEISNEIKGTNELIEDHNSLVFRYFLVAFLNKSEECSFITVLEDDVDMI